MTTPSKPAVTRAAATKAAGAESGYPRKRARTRRQLMDAGMVVFAAKGPDGATVGEIARAANVATGTFYNHFPSLPDLVAAVTDELTRGVRIGRETLDEIEHDPALRVLLGTRQLLGLTASDPASAAAFVALLADVPDFRIKVRTIVSSAIADGIAAERFAQRDLESVTDALLGAVIQWMRSALAGATSGSLEERLIITLSILGVSQHDGAQLARIAVDIEEGADD